MLSTCVPDVSTVEVVSVLVLSTLVDQVGAGWNSGMLSTSVSIDDVFSVFLELFGATGFLLHELSNAANVNKIA